MEETAHPLDTEQLVDGKYGIRDLVDIDELQRIFDRFYDATGFTIGFLDHPGLNILVHCGWRDICTKYHRINPTSFDNCRRSNQALLNSLNEPGELKIEECQNGLVDCAFPIIIKGKHIASLATGQLLLKPPDIERFKRQAALFGLDESEYLKALEEIPVVTEEKLRAVTTFLGEMALVLSQMGYARLAMREDAERLEKEVFSRKETEKALAAERERLLVTLRSIGDGVITTDTAGNIVLMNKVAEEMTGWSLSESIGLPLTHVFSIVCEETRQRCDNPVEKVLSTGQIVGLANHTILQCRNGRELYIADSGAAIRDTKGEIVGVVLVFRDVTERQKAEQALQNAQKLQSLGVLAGAIAHDFNNYLGGILGHVELARESIQVGDPSGAGRELAEVSGIFSRARSLTRRLLTFAKGEMPVLKAGSVSEVVREIAGFTATGSNVALDFDIRSEVPDCAFDPSQIAQVVQNLVLNAMQAMPQGGHIHITVEPTEFSQPHAVLASGRYVKVTVADDGPGIPPDLLPRIFDPFFTTKRTGTGLGLSICYSIVRKHQGHIEVFSKVGKGTQFVFYLPATAAARVEEVEQRPRQLHHGFGAALVMDDDPCLLEVAAAMLQRAGYDTTMVSRGEEALEELARQPFRLALLDLTIAGGMGGKETAAKIRECCGHTVVIIAMSGYSESEAIAVPLEAGFDASIAKPFTISELAEVLESVLPSNP